MFLTGDLVYFFANLTRGIYIIDIYLRIGEKAGGDSTKMDRNIKRRIYNLIGDDSENRLAGNILNSVLIFLILVNVLFIILDTFVHIRPLIMPYHPYVEIISLILFTIEYVLRMWTADYIYPNLKPGKARIKYMFTGKALIDLIALLPFYAAFIAIFDARALSMIRLVRILSILKIGRYTGALATIAEVLKKKSLQLFSSLFVVMLLILFSSVSMYYIEYDAQPEVFNNAFSGLWWAISTLTTVGYGDIYPITIIGKIIGAFIAVLGIGLVAVPTGIISAGFIEQMTDSKEESQKKKYCPHCGEKL